MNEIFYTAQILQLLSWLKDERLLSIFQKDDNIIKLFTIVTDIQDKRARVSSWAQSYKN